MKLFLTIFSLAVVSCVHGLSLDLNITLGDSIDPLQVINIVFYFGDKNQQSVSYPLINATQIFQHPAFDVNRNTTIYVPGWTENQTYISTPTIKEAYSYRNINLIVLDYYYYSKGDYVSSVNNIFQIAPAVTATLSKLFDSGLKIDKFHLVGHSLGGQFVGLIGRTLQKLYNIILQRISALDPAGPLFYGTLVVEHINKNDAKFVDVSHTDAGFYGAPISTGTVDFWPSDGDRFQPGCPIVPPFITEVPIFPDNIKDSCSHWRSWMFWAESVKNTYNKQFLAYRASSYLFYLFEIYDKTVYTTMGIDTDTNLSGDFYLDVNPQSPYAQT